MAGDLHVKDALVDEWVRTELELEELDLFVCVLATRLGPQLFLALLDENLILRNVDLHHMTTERILAASKR